MEIYFWAFVVAILLFAIGAGVAIYEGIHKIQAPTPISDPAINYVVLALAVVLGPSPGGWLSRNSKRPDSATF